MGAVAVVVVTVAGAGDDVDAVVVVDVAVAVVVDAVVGGLGLVDPDVAGQILVIVIHAGVDDGDDHAGAAAGDGDGVHALENAAGVQIPLVAHPGIAQQGSGDLGVVADVCGVDLIVVVHHQDAVQSAKLLHGGGDVGAQDEACLIPGGVFQLEEHFELCHACLSHGAGHGAVHGAGELEEQGLAVEGHLLGLHQLGVELVEGDGHGAVLVVAAALGVDGGLVLGLGGDLGLQLILDQVGQLLVGQVGVALVRADDEIGDLLQTVPVGLHGGRAQGDELDALGLRRLGGGGNGLRSGLGLHGCGLGLLCGTLDLDAGLGLRLGSAAAASGQRDHHHSRQHQRRQSFEVLHNVPPLMIWVYYYYFSIS